MQATATSKQLSPRALAEDLFAVTVFLMKSSTRDLFQALGELDLSMTQVKALHCLEPEDRELTLKELGEQLGLSFPAASRAAEGLHQRGLIERREDEHDRRMKRVRATASGREIVQRFNEARMSALEQFAGTLSESERRRLAAALAPVVARTDVAACRPERTSA